MTKGVAVATLLSWSELLHSPADPDLTAPYNYGLSLLPILVYNLHPEGITGIRGFLRLNGHVSLGNAPGPSEKAGDYDHHGARLVRGYNDPCSKELGSLVP